MGNGSPDYDKEPNWKLLALASALDPSGARGVSSYIAGLLEHRRRKAEQEMSDIEQGESSSFETPEEGYKAVLGLTPRTIEGRRARNESLTRTYRRYGEDVISKARVPDENKPAVPGVPETTQEFPYSPDRAERGGAPGGERYPDEALAVGNLLNKPVSDLQVMLRQAQPGAADRPILENSEFGPVPKVSGAPSEFAGYRTGPAATAIITEGKAAQPQGTRRPQDINELRRAIEDDAQFRAALAAHKDLAPHEYSTRGDVPIAEVGAALEERLKEAVDEFATMSPEDQKEMRGPLANVKATVAAAKRDRRLSDDAFRQLSSYETARRSLRGFNARQKAAKDRSERFERTFAESKYRFNEYLRAKDLQGMETEIGNLEREVGATQRMLNDYIREGREDDPMTARLREQLETSYELLKAFGRAYDRARTAPRKGRDERDWTRGTPVPENPQPQIDRGAIQRELQKRNGQPSGQ